MLGLLLSGVADDKKETDMSYRTIREAIIFAKLEFKPTNTSLTINSDTNGQETSILHSTPFVDRATDPTASTNRADSSALANHANSSSDNPVGSTASADPAKNVQQSASSEDTPLQYQMSKGDL